MTDLSVTFAKAGSVNADLSGWDVSSVTKMDNTFANAAKFASTD